jgi:hypothetical protein
MIHAKGGTIITHCIGWLPFLLDYLYKENYELHSDQAGGHDTVKSRIS